MPTRISTKLTEWKSKTRFFLREHLARFITWNCTIISLSLALGAVVPQMARRNEHDWLKYCDSCTTFTRDSTFDKSVRSINYRAQVIGTAIWIFPSAFLNIMVERRLKGPDQSTSKWFWRVGAMWITLAISMPTGIGILKAAHNSAAANGELLDPYKILGMTIPGGICEIAILYNAIVLLGFTLMFVDWWRKTSLRICGSGELAV